jgi:hypothetical protein
MTIKCRFIKNNIVNVIENKLSAYLAHEVEAHLEKCKKCALLVSKFSGVWSKLDQKEEIKPSPAFWPSLQKKILELEEKSSGKAPVLWSFKRWLRPSVAVLGLFFALFFGYKLGDFPASLSSQSFQETYNPTSVEDDFVSFYLGDFEDFPTGSITELYLTSMAENPGGK